MSNLPDPEVARNPDAPIEPLFIRRWSPRAMTDTPISEEALCSLFEAARWAPSCFNEQPWRFLYTHRTDPEWDDFLGLLMEGNQAWVKNASVLIAVVSSRIYARNGNPAPTHSFDAGAAWAHLALQASELGIGAHGMWGFDHDRAPQVLGVPDDHRIECMVALGRPGDLEDLPEQLRERERPSQRKPQSEFVTRGRFAG